MGCRPMRRHERHSLAGLPAGLLVLVVAAGSAGLFATFWDDAWHSDLGRDQATIPPHLLLYASMATIGAVVAAWGLSALRRGRSPAAVWRQPPLLLAAAGGTVTLAALPIDAAWHARFGRDAVLWSPRTCWPSSAASPCWWASWAPRDPTPPRGS